jgi:hypothetical protein
MDRLASAHSGARVGFASPDALMSFLRRECVVAQGDPTRGVK